MSARPRSMVVLVSLVLLAVLPAARASRVAAAPTDATDVASTLNAVGLAASSWGIDPANVGLAVTDLASGQTWSFNGDTELSFMSSAKFPWVTFATAQAGVAAQQADASAVFGWSDNIAAGRTISRSGGIDNLANWYAALGMSHTCTKIWGYTLLYASTPCTAALGRYTNHSTANDMNTFMKALWWGTIPGLDASERQAVLDWATLSVDEWAWNGDGTVTGYIPRDLWGSARHKVGWNWLPGFSDASDVGIIELGDGRAYAISVVAHGGTSSSAQADYLARAACEAYRAFSGDLAWNCGTRAYDANAGLVDVYLARNGKLAPPTVTVTNDTALMGHVVNGTGGPLTVKLSVTGAKCVGAPATQSQTVAPGAESWIGCRIDPGLSAAIGPTWTVEARNGSGQRIALDTAKATILPGYVFASTSGTRSTFAPVTPTRVLDTRDAHARAAAGSTTTVPIPDGLVPGGGTPTAVAINLIAVGAEAPGYLTAYSGEGARPFTAQVNFDASAYATANSAVVPLGGDGDLALFTTTAVDLVVDVTGVFVAGTGGATYHPASAPTRLLDTRTDGGPVTASAPRALQVTGLAGVPAGASSAVVSVVAIGGPQAGWLSVAPAASGWTGTSSANYEASQAQATTLITPLDGAGQLGLFTSGRAHVVVDLVGWFDSDPGGLRFVPVTPFRAYDSRLGDGDLATGEARIVASAPPSVEGIWASSTMITDVGEGWALLEGAEQDGYASNQYAYGGWIKNFGVLTAVDGGAVKELSGYPGTFGWVLDVSGYFLPS